MFVMPIEKVKDMRTEELFFLQNTSDYILISYPSALVGYQDEYEN